MATLILQIKIKKKYMASFIVRKRKRRTLKSSSDNEVYELKGTIIKPSLEKEESENAQINTSTAQLKNISKLKKLVVLNQETQHPQQPYKTSKIEMDRNSGIYKDLIGFLIESRNEIITNSSQKIKNVKENIKSLESLLVDLHGKRWLLNTYKETNEKIKKLNLKLNFYESGQELIDFDAKMKPLLKKLKKSNHKKIYTDIKDSEREFRKTLTKQSDPIILQRASILDICEDCGLSMNMIENDSLFGCPKCGKVKSLSYICAPVSDAEFVNAPYLQKSRLVEWLEFCQGKEYAEPCDDILQLIMKHLFTNKQLGGLEKHISIITEEYKRGGSFIHTENAISRLQEKIPDLKDMLLKIKPVVVRFAMQAISSKTKDERFRKFYERAPKHCAYITGFWPLRFSNLQEERLRSLYATALPAYEKYRKPSQPNWPGGYAYFLRCLCMLLGWDEFIDHFNVNSGQKNMQEREQIREKIWKRDLDWQFIPSFGSNTPLQINDSSNEPTILGLKRKR
jgi:rubrerythrin